MPKSIAITGSLGGLKPAAAFCVLMEELDALGLRQNVVAYAGSSGSSIWAALAASGLGGVFMTEICKGITSKDMWEDWNYWHLLNFFTHRGRGFTGLMEGDKVRDWLYKYIGRTRFIDLPTYLYIAGYDYNTECEVTFGPLDEVEVVKAVRGSTAIPGAWEGEDIRFPDGKDHKIGDGGINCAVPILPLLKHNPDVIVVIDAAGATEPITPSPWQSMSEKDLIGVVSGAVKSLAERVNAYELELAQKTNPNIRVYHVEHGMSMSDPGGTFPEAYREADAKVRAFVRYNLLT